MNQAFRVLGNSDVSALAGRYITCPWLVFNRAHDTFLPKPYPIIESTNIIFDSCDKKFVYYVLFKEFYPKLQKVYLNSHPCDPNVFLRFKHSNIEIHLIEDFWGYKRWTIDMENVKLITHKELKHIMKNLE
jgi:hypothetical protein